MSRRRNEILNDYIDKTRTRTEIIDEILKHAGSNFAWSTGHFEKRFFVSDCVEHRPSSEMFFFGETIWIEKKPVYRGPFAKTRGRYDMDEWSFHRKVQEFEDWIVRTRIRHEIDKYHAGGQAGGTTP